MQILIREKRRGCINTRQSQFQNGNYTKDKERSYAMRTSVHWEDTVILNVYTTDNRAATVESKIDRTYREINNYSWRF